ncbi:hypothetical protein ACQEU3_15100 [Spirillospora sp. CA-253888]
MTNTPSSPEASGADSNRRVGTKNQRLVPLTVWLCSDSATADDKGAKNEPARPKPGELCAQHRHAVGHQLARHLISSWTMRDELVVEAYTSGDAVLSAAAGLDRRAVALVPLPLAQHIGVRLCATHGPAARRKVEMRPARADQMTRALADQPGQAALVIAAPPSYAVGGGVPKVVGQHGCPACQADLGMLEHLQLSKFLAAAWETLQPSGVLAVVTNARHQDDGRLHDPAPSIIRQASQLGFVYVQHVVALRVPIEGDALAVQHEPGEIGMLCDVGSKAPVPRANVHSDVLLFVRPVGVERDGSQQ